MNNHLILLGDSIIDNNPYVRGTDFPVEKHLKKMLEDLKQVYLVVGMLDNMMGTLIHSIFILAVKYQLLDF